MTRREAWLSALAVFAVAAIVRTWAASIIVFPRPEDTAYYVAVAENLLAGRGLVSDALWSYQTPPLTFPRPAFEVWLPLPTILAAASMAVLGTSFAAAQAPFVVIGALIPVLAWRLAADVARDHDLPAGRSRVLALGVGLTGAVSLPLVLHSALPDSTIPFAALALAACLLMHRIRADPRDGRPVDPRLLALGATLGLAALARNEAVWLALTWTVLVVTLRPLPVAVRARLIAVPAVVAIALFAPWVVRNMTVFGNPLPSQTIANALSVTGYDIFAWSDPPSLSRYLAVGPARLLQMRLEGIGHNLFSVLLLPGFPVALIGLLGLPWAMRTPSIRPLLIVSLITFAFTSLVFPVATTWGTFLHAAGPVHVLLIISALLVLDRAVVRLAAWRGWSRPVAWLGPALTVFAGLAFTSVLLPTFGEGSAATRDRYVALQAQMTAQGVPLRDRGPVITNFPIWLAEEAGVHALALPAETPAAVLDLAASFPGTRTLVVTGDEHGGWPAVLATDQPGTECFREIPLGTPVDPRLARALRDTRVWEIVCS